MSGAWGRQGSTTTLAIGAPFNFTDLVRAPAHQRSVGLELRIQYPLTNTDVAPVIMTIAELLAGCLGSLTARYGPNQDRIIMTAYAPEDVRNHHGAILRGDVITTLPALGVPVGASIQEIRVVIPFTVPQLTDGELRAPGWSLVRTIVIEGTEGTDAGFPALVDRTVGAACIIDYDLVAFPSGLDAAHPILAGYRVVRGSLNAPGPDGCHVAAWESTDPIAATTLDLVSLRVGDLQLGRTSPIDLPADVYAQWWMDNGGFDLRDFACPVLFPSQGESSVDMPQGELEFTQAALDVDPINLRGVYWPNLTQQQTDENATLGATTAGKPRLYSTPPGVAARPSRWARSVGGFFYPPKNPAFTLRPGLLAQPNASRAIASIPTPIVMQTTAALARAKEVGAEVEDKTAKAIGGDVMRAFPGTQEPMAAPPPQANALWDRVRGFFRRR